MKWQKIPLAPPAGDIHAAVLNFIRRGQRAQAAVDAIIAKENERLAVNGPKGRA